MFCLNLSTDCAMPTVKYNLKTFPVFAMIILLSQRLMLFFYLLSISTSYNSYELHISTKSPQGLLLMVGRPTLQGMGDYLLLFINNGRVHLQYNLGSGPAHISSKTRVDNGVLTAIKVNRFVCVEMLKYYNVN